ncbi:MAG TPA: GNAT family N-acetyltransferase [Candidatus Nanopelagicales bacterium]|nr:GNAT family N-acetyltransferase [Candidatus Nanopelagicales bacterium]
MVADAYQRAQAWCTTTMALRSQQAQQVGPGGWLVLTPDWPDSFSHNALVLTADPGPEAALGWADRLGTAGVTHRQLMAYCPLSAATTWALQDAGFELQPELLMARPSSAGYLAAPDVPVRRTEPDAAQVARLQGVLWRQEWLPDATDAVVGQLVGRRSTLSDAGPTSTLVVTDGPDAVACLDVCVRDGVAELDALATLGPYRGRGYGLALMVAGMALAAESDADLVVLTALSGDWPRHWYARLGFAELGPATEATLTSP